MDLKLKIMEKTDIVPLYQRLMFGSVELEKNEATMADLEIPPKSELDLFVFDQGEGAFECLGEMQDVMPVPRDEGGFGGTGLAGDWLDYE
ncbi:hypothetical protein BGW38_004690 [Lunasporangiospora selenospora]|uniref:Ubiquitin-like domain-containing protein n=1 Tax=Lunasporangiospora selenospora TaxID=979761 RepID=A0A9P6KBU9_9FUNG|nr:hypothetical protein BGW38_004690 [Lunasporangiospora selenospora]